MSAPRPARICICLGLLVLLLTLIPTAWCAHDATGRFEVYCDSVGFYLAGIDGAPAPRELVLFMYTGFPSHPIQMLAERWSDVVVYRKGCTAAGDCEILARGKVWLDAGFASTSAPKHISGKYELDLNGQLLKGQFTAKLHKYKNPPRICM